jgi:hypothetical protein
MRATATAQVGGLRFRFQAGEFFQNNPYILPLMLEHVVSQASAPGLDCLVDAYCGVGAFALYGAGKFREVAGVEISEAAVRLAARNAQLNGIANCTFLLGSAEAIFGAIRFDPARTAMVIDPPRAVVTSPSCAPRRVRPRSRRLRLLRSRHTGARPEVPSGQWLCDHGGPALRPLPADPPHRERRDTRETLDAGPDPMDIGIGPLAFRL